MNVLSYLWILALIPFLTQKEDAEIQWHAKNGLVITAAEFVAYLIVFVLSMITAFLGCFLNPVVFLGFVILRIIGIVKANKGERLVVPGVSQFADSF